jgi:hypothetical protein
MKREWMVLSREGIEAKPHSSSGLRLGFDFHRGKSLLKQQFHPALFAKHRFLLLFAPYGLRAGLDKKDTFRKCEAP